MELVEVDSFALLCQVLMPAEAVKDDHRAFPRWITRFPLLHGPGAPTQFGLAVDINDDGMCFLTAANYAEGTILRLELRIVGGPIQLCARVCYCGGGTAGVQFLNLSREQRRALLYYCVVGVRKKPN